MMAQVCQMMVPHKAWKAAVSEMRRLLGVGTSDSLEQAICLFLQPS